MLLFERLQGQRVAVITWPSDVTSEDVGWSRGQGRSLWMLEPMAT